MVNLLLAGERRRCAGGLTPPARRGLVPAVVKMKLNTFLHGPNSGKLKAS